MKLCIQAGTYSHGCRRCIGKARTCLLGSLRKRNCDTPTRPLSAMTAPSSKCPRFRYLHAAPRPATALPQICCECESAYFELSAACYDHQPSTCCGPADLWPWLLQVLALSVKFKLPSHVLVRESPPRVAWWDSMKRKWDTNGVENVSFNEETREVHALLLLGIVLMIAPLSDKLRYSRVWATCRGAIQEHRYSIPSVGTDTYQPQSGTAHDRDEDTHVKDPTG